MTTFSQALQLKQSIKVKIDKTSVFFIPIYKMYVAIIYQVVTFTWSSEASVSHVFRNSSCLNKHLLNYIPKITILSKFYGTPKDCKAHVFVFISLALFWTCLYWYRYVYTILRQKVLQFTNLFIILNLKPFETNVRLSKDVY